jgi:hypothetical protein
MADFAGNGAFASEMAHRLDEMLAALPQAIILPATIAPRLPLMRAALTPNPKKIRTKLN